MDLHVFPILIPSPAEGVFTWDVCVQLCKHGGTIGLWINVEMFAISIYLKK